MSQNTKTENPKSSKKSKKGTTLSSNIEKSKLFTSYKCSNGNSVRAGLANAANLIIRKLAQYERLCGGQVTDKLMVFTSMPTNASQANANAADMAFILKEFAKYKLKPLVIMEPTASSGIIDLKKFSEGYYDPAFDSFFKSLKSRGITDTTMGTWAPLPESNIPEWGSTNPSIFKINFVKATKAQKKYFPGSKTSIVLDSLSYPPGTLDWDNGSHVSLAPYIKGIPKGLVDSFGYQGFPWAAPAGQPYSNYDAAKFLKPNIAKEAADLLGTKNIWLNTGTFTSFYSQEPKKKVTMSAQKRSQILKGIIAQGQWLKSRGYKVNVSLFAENKANSEEGVDWSYWHGSNPAGQNANILKGFIAELRAKSMGFWLFDSY